MARRFLWVAALPFAIYGQNPDSAPRFEVAAIKVHPIGEPVSKTNSPGQHAVFGISLKRLLLGAYGITEYQLAGPGWMSSEPYDLVAKVPPGTTEAQRRVMLQNLLTERFQIRLHHEQRVLNAYELTIASGGLKLTAAAPDAKPDYMRKGAALNGRVTMTAEHCSLSKLAEGLSEELGELVQDKTATPGLFAFSFQFARRDSTDPEAGSPLPSVLQSQLGLRLEPRKAPMDVLVIDHAEKVPVEN